MAKIKQMPNNFTTLGRRIGLPLVLLLAALFCARAQTFTNLQQIAQALNQQPRLFRNVDLSVTVCAASRPKVGVLIVQDSSGVELLEIGSFDRDIRPGDRLVIRGWYCLFRKREMGIEISPQPVVDNDGLHFRRTMPGTVRLKAGPVPMRLEWFGYTREFNLEASYVLSNGPAQWFGATNLFHAVTTESGTTNYLPGLRAEFYEGYWEYLPEFDLLQPVRTGIVTNINLESRTREDCTALRYTGFFQVPVDGEYTFRLRSSEGSMLYLDARELSLAGAGVTNVPEPERALFGEALGSLSKRRWASIAGRVKFVSKRGEGMEFELHSDRDVVLVRVADAAGLDAARLLNARVKVTGIDQGVMTADQRIVLGKFCVASAAGIVSLEPASPGGDLSLPITSVGQVQGLKIEDARHNLPVRIRGIVTDAKNSRVDRWMSIQDDTRGIFVSLRLITNEAPAFGQYWEVEGRSAAGDFAPVILADKLTLLGDGRLPEPVRPTWTELLNGSKDVQWAELHGLVTAVQSNTVTLLLPEGRLDVQMAGFFEPELKPFQRSVVRIRGVLYAVWNAETREVLVGQVVMRNATIVLDAPAPADPFDAVLKTPRELLLFDAQATAFRRVKVRGQIVYADGKQLYLEDGGAGLRLLSSEPTDLRLGDLVEAVGYPDIGRTVLLLREVILRKTGEAPLPALKKLTESDLTQPGLDSTRVRIQGRLLGWHSEQGALILEMQSGAHLYLARLAQAASYQTLRAGSRLALKGVYIDRGRNQRSNGEVGSFEILLNSPADIVILTQPSWWTLQRLLIVVGILLVGLAFTAIWITQLRRLVEQRTTQLRQEIRERERVEHQHAIEAERSRIARDLHDDLGASLTEISVLASTGQRPGLGEASHPNLFHSIAGKARSLIAALDVIVWAVDPEDNSLQSLADYLTGYAEDFFSHTNISCRFKVPVTFPQVTLDGRVRHDLLMVVKEAFNNIVRHSEATEVEFRMAGEGNLLEIIIADNGRGFDPALARDGHGLKNLPARLEKLGGKCELESHAGGGTTVKIRLPLAGTTEARSNVSPG